MMPRILRLQTLRINTHPMVFDGVLMSGISSVCPPVHGEPGNSVFEME